MKHNAKHSRQVDSTSIKDTASIPVIEERVHVGKEKVEKGKVYLSMRTAEEEVTSDVELEQDDVEVKHVPINRSVDEAPTMRKEGDTMIIPVVKEEVEIRKRLVLVEEVHIINTKQKDTRAVKATVKKQKVSVRREATEPENGK